MAEVIVWLCDDCYRRFPMRYKRLSENQIQGRCNGSCKHDAYHEGHIAIRATRPYEVILFK